jgi:beta-lactam-binding protein with PASTA domain
VLVVGIWLIMRANDSGTGDETPTPTASVVPTTAVAPTTAAPPTSAPATATSGPVSIEVPRVVGLTQADAQARLDAAGLPYRLEFRPSDRPAGTVIDTDPAGGMTVPEGTQVILVIAESAPTSAPPTSAPTSEAAGPSPTS